MAPSLSPNGENRRLSEQDPGRSSQLDLSLQHFTSENFDPAEYLNENLITLNLSTPQSQASSRTTVSSSLGEISSKSQTLLSQLSAQNARLSSVLTQLTEDILRSSGRLAYEVEILRGDTIGLSDVLTESLRNDIENFIVSRAENTTLGENGDTVEDTLKVLASSTSQDAPRETGSDAGTATEPEFISRLRMLGHVRSKLEEVVKVFGDAMEWPLPPSELSFSSSFISVSAPDSGPDSASREEKGQEVAKRLRAEISDLLDSNGGSEAGVAAAQQRVDQLRVLATVWKGTAEEKARSRFVDGLAKIVDDRKKALEIHGKDGDLRRGGSQHSSLLKKGRTSTDLNGEDCLKDDSGGPGGGLFRNLQRIRDEIYLE